MTPYQAHSILTKHTYFTRYYADTDSFDNDFKSAVDIEPFENGTWWCEFGSFCLDSGLFYHNYTYDIFANSYEECLIKLVERKKNVFKMVGSKLLYYILCLTPIVQLFMILLELFIIVAYCQTTNEELVEKLKEDWMKEAV